MSAPVNNNEIQIELTDAIAQGTYSNLAVITHSTSEFVIDFIRLMPGVPKAPVKARVILTPEHAKRLMYALEENVSRYENEFGAIRLSEGAAPTLPFPTDGIKN